MIPKRPTNVQAPVVAALTFVGITSATPKNLIDF